MRTDASSAPSASLRASLAALFQRVGPDDPSAVEALRPLYADDVVFEDPIQRVEGVDAFLDVNRRLLARAKKLRFDLERTIGDDDELVLVWRMTFQAKVGPEVHVDGVSHLRARGGKITHHRDYWDLATLLASGVPGGERALRFALRPFA